MPIFCDMVFLLDAISASIKYLHYKIFEVDTDVLCPYKYEMEGLKKTAPTPFYLSKIKLDWKTDILVPESLLADLASQLGHYLFSRRQEQQRVERNKLNSL